MTKHLLIMGAIALSFVAPAWADPVAIAKAHDELVNNAVKQCKPQNMIALYENNAVAIYPGESEIGRTRKRSKDW
jgi:hypothetical protein